MKSGTPGEHHASMQEMVGTWDVAGKFWMQPGQPPMESKGESTFTSILGGRYVQHEHTSQFGDKPFEGFGIDGYDNMKEKHIAFWIDSFGTSFYPMEGTCEDDHSVVTLFGEWPEPATGGTMLVKSVSREVDADTVVYEMYIRHSEEEEWHQNMELTYTRQKEEKK